MPETETETALPLQTRLKPVLPLYLGLVTGYWLYTGISTPYLGNWLAESTLFVSVVICLVVFYRYFRFSVAAYSCFALFLLLHLHGAHYSYPEAPAGALLARFTEAGRNSYDRLVHFAFGLCIALPMFELGERALKLPKAVRWWWPLELTLALSAFFELVEWLVAQVFFPALGTSYLGFQGDVWDAQKDMALALLGSGIGLLGIWVFGKRKQAEGLPL